MTYLLLPLGYLCGALPFGWVMGRLHGVDIMSVGSKNIGATNVWRTCGAKSGALVMALDIAKGWLPTMLAMHFAPGQAGLHVAVAALTVAGHSASIFLSFRGGKGVATACGAVIALDPLAAVVGLATFFGVIAITRYVSIGSLTSSVALGLVLTFHGRPTLYLVVVWGCIAWIFWRHRANMGRLWRGEEPKFSAKGRTVQAEPEPAAEPPAEASS